MPAGNAGVEPVVPDHDAPVTARVLEAGAVVLGSTVMPDWGMLSSGVSSRHGITRSPWNPAWTTGGSSSGAGAAAAGGYGPLHVGTDIGGSIRLPGSWLGLVALKPSAGRVPLDTPYLGRVAGPMTRTVADAALLMRVISRPDARDWTSLPPEDLDWLDLDRPVSGLRVGLHLDAGCGAPVDAAGRRRRTPGRGVLRGRPGRSSRSCRRSLTRSCSTPSTSSGGCGRGPTTAGCRSRPKRRVLPYIAEWVHGGADVSGRAGARLLPPDRAAAGADRRRDPAVRPGALARHAGAGVPGRAADARSRTRG